MEMDPSLREGSQATVNVVSATPPQPLMTTAAISQEDMMGTLIQTIRQEIQKVLPQTNQNSSTSRSSSTDGVRFVLIVPDQIGKVQLQTKTKTTEIQTTTKDTITIRKIDTITRAINKTTDIITIAIHQTSSKTEITQTNNLEDNVTEQITSPGIVKHVLIAEDWDICLANVKHRDKFKTIGNKIRMITNCHEIIIKTAT